jgi:PAS domain S-box-containing protein
MAEHLSQKTILLVEDEALIAMNEAAILKKQGYGVITAYNAQKAIETAREKAVDLILMDIDLGVGKMDGTEAAEIILKEKDIPVVFLSSHTEPEVVEKTEGITSYGYIVKNSGETVLLASIKMAFRLFEAKSIYKDTFTHSINGICIHKMIYNENNGLRDCEYINVNSAFEKHTGLSSDFVKGKTVREIYPGNEADDVIDVYSEVIANRTPQTKEIYFKPLQKWYELSVFPMEGDHFSVVIQSVTDRYNFEEKLKNLFEESPIGIGLYRADGHIIEMNKEFLEIFGVSNAAEVNNFNLFQDPNLTKEVKEKLAKRENVRYKIDFDFENIKRNNLYETSRSGTVYLDVLITPLAAKEENDLHGYLVQVVDINDRKRVEDTVHSIEWMLSNKTTRGEDYIPEYGDVSFLNKDGFILTSVGKEQLKDIASEYLDLLETSTAIYEKNGDYALGIFSSGWCRLMDSASRRLCDTEDNQEALKSGKWLCHESCWKDASISIEKDRPVEIECNGGLKMYAVPVHVNGEAVGAINFGYGSPPTDEAELKSLSEKYNIPIDELRKNAKAYNPRPQFIIDYAKERIQKAAKNLGYIIEGKRNDKQKDYLMKELNHRVKNNLSMVSSLIKLKNSALGGDVDLSDLDNRINAIRLVHEKLYQTEDISHINFKEYIHELNENVFSLSKRHIEIEEHIDDISLSTRTAIPLGLIANELATNAMKYGFTNGEEAVFSVNLTADKNRNQYVLTISNTGKPFPKGVALDNPETLGLRLITALVQQLRGTIELRRDPYPVFTIRFPKDAAL